jgi:hypothetical protein
MNESKKSHTAGRPPKFREARRPVTVTLPVRVLEVLKTVNPDRAMAIARLADAADRGLCDRKPVEIVEVAPHRGLIVVADSAMLRSIEGLRLIEISPARYLITVKASLSVESLEVQIQDMIEEGTGSPEEILLLRDLLQQLRHQRRRKAVSKEELLIINM